MQTEDLIAAVDREWVEVDRLEKAAQVYALAAADYCGFVGKEG